MARVARLFTIPYPLTRYPSSRRIASCMNAELQHRRPSRLEALKRALDQGTMRQVHRLVNSMHPAEVASLLESLPPHAARSGLGPRSIPNSRATSSSSSTRKSAPA